MRRSAISLLLYILILAALAAVAPRRSVGDAGEYTAYALAIADGHSPTLTREAISDVRRDFAAIDPELGAWDLAGAAHRSSDGRLEFVHFWGYSAIAAPFVAAARALHADPRDGFAVLNVLLLAAAFGVVSRRLSIGAAWLIGLSPILWWTDKAQIEVFVFALTTIGLAMRDRPIVSGVCIGLAATQVPPLAVLLLIAGVDAGGVTRALTGIAAGLAMAAIPIAHYLWSFHTPALLAGAAHVHWPSRAEFGVALLDLNLGLVPNWPAAAAIVVLAVVAGVARTSAAWRDLLTSALAIAVLAVAFAQIGNVMSGGTPGVLRYAVWLIPLAVPLLQRIVVDAAWTRVVAVLAILSAPMSLVRDRPSVPEFSGRPSAVSLAVWRYAPAWSRPLPMVFAGSLGSRTLPVATADCSKILLMGRGDAQGTWPRACAPAGVPAECREPGRLCYANRSSSGYTFDRLDESTGDLKFDPARAWLQSSSPSSALAPHPPIRVRFSIVSLSGATPRIPSIVMASLPARLTSTNSMCSPGAAVNGTFFQTSVLFARSSCAPAAISIVRRSPNISEASWPSSMRART